MRPLFDPEVPCLWHERFEVLSFIRESSSEIRIAVERKVSYLVGRRVPAAVVRAVEPQWKELEQLPTSFAETFQGRSRKQRLAIFLLRKLVNKSIGLSIGLVDGCVPLHPLLPTFTSDSGLPPIKERLQGRDYYGIGNEIPGG